MAGTRFVIAAALGLATSLAGLLTMTGHMRGLVTPALSAEVQLSDYPLPSGFGVQPQEVADFLAAELAERVMNDIALRVALGEEGQQRLIEIGLPRLVSTTVVQDMIQDIPPLARVLSMAEFRMAAQVVVRNSGPNRPDVALTLPGALLAEAETGSVEITAASTGLTVVVLGDMAAGETRMLRVWLGSAALDLGPEFGKSVLLGDGNDDSGRVWIYDREGWYGADLQAMAWARWLVAAVLLIVLVASGFVMGIAALTTRGTRTIRV